MSDRNVRKVRIGKVVSDKMEKTVVVAVEELEQQYCFLIEYNIKTELS